MKWNYETSMPEDLISEVQYCLEDPEDPIRQSRLGGIIFALEVLTARQWATIDHSTGLILMNDDCSEAIRPE